MYRTNDHIAVAAAGVKSDANLLINYARIVAQRYRLSFEEEIPLEQLVRGICDKKQAYTQFGGTRPLGVSFLYAGWCDIYISF